jgi:hypothetical protein
LKFLPFLAFLGIGINLLLTAFMPSWREKGWKHWQIFIGPPHDIRRPNSWWVALGIVKPRRPSREGDWDEKTAIWVWAGMGAALSLIGIAGLALVYLTNS